MPLQDNIVVQTSVHGGPIMWPILATAVVAGTVLTERTVWWIAESARRRPAQVNDVLGRIESGDIDGASKLARNSKDPFLRVIWHGLNHYHSSLGGALQQAVDAEVERAERFLAVLDTVVTLAPLLGLLGTVTGIMATFQSLGNDSLAVSKVTGGIGEALIATACGLIVAIVSLLPLNYFNRRKERLQSRLDSVATDVELLVEKGKVSLV